MNNKKPRLRNSFRDLFVFIVLQILCIVDVTSTKILKHIPRIFQSQNDINIGNIVLISEGNLECKSNDILCRNIYSELLFDVIDLPFVFVYIGTN